MEDNMGQVNTMIGNLRNMALDMGSELENQNKQIDRINRKVGANYFYFILVSFSILRLNHHTLWTFYQVFFVRKRNSKFIENVS